jgi:hypothetical protein
VRITKKNKLNRSMSRYGASVARSGRFSGPCSHTPMAERADAKSTTAEDAAKLADGDSTRSSRNLESASMSIRRRAPTATMSSGDRPRRMSAVTCSPP